MPIEPGLLTKAGPNLEKLLLKLTDVMGVTELSPSRRNACVGSNRYAATGVGGSSGKPIPSRPLAVRASDHRRRLILEHQDGLAGDMRTRSEQSGAHAKRHTTRTALQQGCRWMISAVT